MLFLLIEVVDEFFFKVKQQQQQHQQTSSHQCNLKVYTSKCKLKK